MAGFSETQALTDFYGNPLLAGDKGNPFSDGSSTLNEARAAGAQGFESPESGMSMGAVMGMTQALTGLAGSFQEASNARSALTSQCTQSPGLLLWGHCASIADEQSSQ